MFKFAIDPIKFGTLIEINNLINSQYADLNVLLTAILESATKLTDSEASSLLLLDQEQQRLHFVIALGSKGQEVKSFTLKVGEGIAGWVAQNNRSLIANDAEDDPRFFSDISKSVGFKTTSILAVPMRDRSHCVGVLEMINKKSGASFNEEDLSWLEIFANQAGIALQNARSYLAVKNELTLLKGERETPPGFHQFLFKSEQMIKISQLVDKFAASDATVLITGESGSGKELVAEQIHLKSNRRNSPFIRINCASLPETLLETELFGHMKGAFTDALETKKGRFELAQGGTLLLDEIGEMTLNLQAKFLRVLQSKVFERVGGTETLKTDVRIIASTNKSLTTEVESGRFRSDLFYRLNVLPLEVPPLRQRMKDITLLSEYFFNKFLQKSPKKLKGFSSQAMEKLYNYSWPGNVRELENSVERAVILASGPYIEPTDLGLEQENEDSNSTDLKSALVIYKNQYIKKILNQTGGNQTQAARILGLQRTYLSKLVNEFENTKIKETI